MADLKDFMISKVRVEILKLLFVNAEDMYFVRQICRAIKQEVNAVRRELERMHTSGLLKAEKRANRIYYSPNKSYPYFQELVHLVAKSVGMGEILRKNASKFGKIEYAIFSYRFIMHQPPRNEEVDLLIIGDIVLAEVQNLVKNYQEENNREVNYAVFSNEEFEFRKTRRDPFIMDILYGSNIMVIGEEGPFYERSLPAA